MPAAPMPHARLRLRISAIEKSGRVWRGTAALRGLHHGVGEVVLGAEGVFAA